jgi:hypothetical protein
VRRHAKASTAGSTQRQAGRPGQLFAGVNARRAPSLFNARRAPSLDVRGSGGRRTSRIAILLAALASCLVLALSAGSASAVAPTIASTSVSSVTPTTAVLHAEINPGGEATAYHFEYGGDDCSSNPCTSIPAVDAGIGSGGAALHVSKEVIGLQPGTTYHFRVVATNPADTSASVDNTFHTFKPAVINTSCPNQATRYGLSASLPDCRAYEMVSPVDKGGGDIRTEWTGLHGRTALNQSASDGNKLTYSSWKSFGDQVASHYSNQYIATRGADGWTSHGIDAPLLGPTIFDPFFSPDVELNIPYEAFTDDLSIGWLWDQGLEPLAPGAQEGFINLYERNNENDKFQTLTIAEPAEVTNAPQYMLGIEGYSDDGSHAIFVASAALTPDAATTTNEQLYDFTEGEIHLVSVLPNDEPAANGANAGNGIGGGYATRYSAWRDNVVSDDGSRIFWLTEPSTNSGTLGKIYVRIDGMTTVPVSAGSNGTWKTAATDGSKALYTEGGDFNGLGGELIEFDVDAETRTTVAAEVQGVAGASDDLSYIYFVSKEALASGATAGEFNFYVDHEGAKTFITTLSEEDVKGTTFGGETLVHSSAKYHNSSVTPDGGSVAFMSNLSLTGYDNTSATTGQPAQEVYVYNLESNSLICASCNPSGARPLTQPLQHPHGEPNYPIEAFGGEKMAAAGWITTAPNPYTSPRILTEDGSTLFFNAFDALVPEDTNNQQDVYQWKAPGSGGCDQPNGCTSLISTGQSPEKSEFIDSSVDGRDVFFETDSSIVTQDPGLVDIYNARAGGGYPRLTHVTPCLGDACQSVPPLPNDATPASASFRGAGNAVPRKARGRCRARRQATGKKAKAKRKNAKSCRRANRRTGR